MIWPSLISTPRFRVALWDIMRGRCVRHFPENTKYDEVLKDLSKMPHAHNASWFSASAQSGTIEVSRLLLLRHAVALIEDMDPEAPCTTY